MICLTHPLLIELLAVPNLALVSGEVGPGMPSRPALVASLPRRSPAMPAESASVLS
jgi:hypothetical protein